MGRRVISSSLFNVLNLGYCEYRVSKNAVWEAKEEKYGPKGDWEGEQKCRGSKGKGLSKTGGLVNIPWNVEIKAKI